MNRIDFSKADKLNRYIIQMDLKRLLSNSKGIFMVNKINLKCLLKLNYTLNTLTKDFEDDIMVLLLMKVKKFVNTWSNFKRSEI